MMAFEDDCAWFYLMNAKLDMFKIELPYDLVRDLRPASEHEAVPTLADLQDWLKTNSVRLFIPIVYRAQTVETSTDRDDYRAKVTRIAKDSALYHAALEDRRASLLSQDAPRFVPHLRIIYRPEDKIYDDNLTDLRPKTAPLHPTH